MGLFQRWAEKRRAPSLTLIYIVESPRIAFKMAPWVATVMGSRFVVTSLNPGDPIPSDGYCISVEEQLEKVKEVSRLEPADILRKIMLTLKESI